MNAIDKRKMVEGVLYDFNVHGKCSEATLDVLIHIKDKLRKSGLRIVANKFGQLEVIDVQTDKCTATAFVI